MIIFFLHILSLSFFVIFFIIIAVHVRVSWLVNNVPQKNVCRIAVYVAFLEIYEFSFPKSILHPSRELRNFSESSIFHHQIVCGNFIARNQLIA